jgi:hypothetical protein
MGWHSRDHAHAGRKSKAHQDARWRQHKNTVCGRSRPRQACPSARQKKAPGYVFISAKADRGLHKQGGARRVRDNMRE